MNNCPIMLACLPPYHPAGWLYTRAIVHTHTTSSYNETVQYHKQKSTKHISLFLPRTIVILDSKKRRRSASTPSPRRITLDPETYNRYSRMTPKKGKPSTSPQAKKQSTHPQDSPMDPPKAPPPPRRSSTSSSGSNSGGGYFTSNQPQTPKATMDESDLIDWLTTCSEDTAKLK
jgi:hypothetical protein